MSSLLPPVRRGALDGATVVLGVSGGIAAYKAVEVMRRLIDAGSHVVPVLTTAALRFVGEQTFSALGSEPARTQLFGGDDPIPHTGLGKRADLVVVAPATARVIGAYAAGISSDLLTATLLATRAPVLVCPAMHTEMWEHPAVQENLATLRRRGVHVLEPDEGRLAGGDLGSGRLPAPERIVAAAAAILAGTDQDLAGLSVLVTAGGTREPIDPVRVIANRSSGKQGYAIAAAARDRGAFVTLVTTVALEAPVGCEVVAVETASQMAEAVLSRKDSADVVVMAAAVADFRPVEVASSKLKKHTALPPIVLEPTLDILAELGRSKREGQVLVGFAAETERLVEQAAEKLSAKRADVIVGNDVGAEGAGFSGDTNAVTIVTREHCVEVPLNSKRAVAEAVLDEVLHQLRSRTTCDHDHPEGAAGT